MRFVEDVLDLPKAQAEHKILGAAIFSIPFLMYVVDHFATNRVCVPKAKHARHWDIEEGVSVQTHVYVAGTKTEEETAYLKQHYHVVETRPSGPPSNVTVVIMEHEELRLAIYNCLENRDLEIMVLYLTGVVGTEAHANGVVVNTLQRTVMRVEPNGQWDHRRRSLGAEEEAHDDLMNMLEEGTTHICGELFPGYKCIQYSDVETCPRYLGLQDIQQHSTAGGGYCAAWSQFLLTTQILNPDYTFDELTDAIVKRTSPKGLKVLIRRFVDYVDLVMQAHRPDVWDQYLKEIGLHKPEEFQRYISPEQSKNWNVS
jgi:hypothetical protein